MEELLREDKDEKIKILTLILVAIWCMLLVPDQTHPFTFFMIMNKSSRK
jgi:hypothetical protein